MQLPVLLAGKRYMTNNNNVTLGGSVMFQLFAVLLSFINAFATQEVKPFVAVSPALPRNTMPRNDIRKRLYLAALRKRAVWNAGGVCWEIREEWL
jgi:hypothetical protein